MTPSRCSEMGDDVSFITSAPRAPFSAPILVPHEAVVRWSGLLGGKDVEVQQSYVTYPRHTKQCLSLGPRFLTPPALLQASDKCSRPLLTWRCGERASLGIDTPDQLLQSLLES